MRGSVTRMGLLSLVVFLGACATAPTGARFYGGEPLPAAQVAVVAIHRHCVLDEFMGKGALRSVYTFEVLPGQYDLCLRYNVSGTYSRTSSRGCANLKLNAQAGNVYYVYPSVPAPGRWEPAVASFSGDEDFAKFNPPTLSSLDDGARIKERTASYLHGERSLIKVSARGFWE
jgi:hypothetical protein